jgi:multidrug efflux pump subunit AcrA (membrane-fusion protein)
MNPGQWSAVVGLLAAMAIPVPQSIVAPARVVPQDPVVVAAPMEGVVRDITVRPNERVEPGQVLFRYVAAELEANLAVAERAVAAAEADLRRARQQAFGDPASAAEVALKQAALELEQVELDYGRYLASQIEVTAERAGVAVFADPAEWRGRPVQTGIRVMEIADPDRVRLDIDIPVGDAVTLRQGAEVSLFLDVDPLNPIAAMLERVAYGAEPTIDDVLAYRASALFAEGVAPPRIGLHGTVRVFGDPVPLGLFLFRKPLAAARGFLGF